MTVSRANPILACVTRGDQVESFHRGAYAVTGEGGALVDSAGDINRPIYPRSSIKAFQCLAMLESGAADRFGFSEEEIALACSSHNAEPEHLEVARSMLSKAGNAASDYECGAHWPIHEASKHEMVLRHDEPQPIHNNCSGKHAGMLAMARALGEETSGYVDVKHPVQEAVAATIGSLCELDLGEGAMGLGTDGCSVPTWTLPLEAMARGFSRFTDPSNQQAVRILKAVAKYPFLVAGSERFDTKLMKLVPRVFIKTGAEGVYGACVPHARIGIALKIDDGAKRASELSVARVLASLKVWTAEEQAILDDLCQAKLYNWRGLEIGEKHAISIS